MTPSGHFPRMLAWTLGAGILLGGAGCLNFLVPKHKVLVDAISAPGVAKPNGKSYRLVPKKSVLTQVRIDVKIVEACLDAGLVGLGMFKVPANVAPELFIEVGYGIDTGGRTDPGSRETFLQLSARDNPGLSLDKATGAELWDVRVAVLGIAGRVESAMPLLCAVAVNHIATDTHMETKIEIPKNSPLVNVVRETAIKTLEGGAAVAAPPPAQDAETTRAPMPPPGAPPTPGAK